MNSLCRKSYLGSDMAHFQVSGSTPQHSTTAIVGLLPEPLLLPLNCSSKDHHRFSTTDIYRDHVRGLRASVGIIDHVWDFR